jgi:hypothetical protein
LNGISEMGSAARSSASAVQRLTSDEIEFVRRAAAEALKSITGRAQAGQDSANKLTAHNAGGRSQFRFAVLLFWPGVCEFNRSAQT